MFDKMQLLQAVRDALQIAIFENGYTDLLTDPAEDVAQDILNCDAAFDPWADSFDEPGFLAEMIGSVEEWQKQYRGVKERK